MSQTPFGKLASLVLLIAASLFFFLVLELGARAYLFCITGYDGDALLYGWQETPLRLESLTRAHFEDNNDDMDVRPNTENEDKDADGTDLTGVPRTPFEEHCGGMVHFSLYGHQATARELLATQTVQDLLGQARAKGRPLTAWCFGGSTTAGYNHSRDASSWPEELEKIAGGQLIMKNYGENGGSSDQSIDRVHELLKSETPPDVVFWANWVNEKDVLYFAMDRNFDQLRERFPELDRPELIRKLRRANAGKYLLRSLSMSLERKVALYRLMQEALQSADIRMADLAEQDGTRKEVTHMGQLFEDGGVAMSVENHLINLRELMTLASDHDFSIVVVRLPSRWRGVIWANGQLDRRWTWAGPYNAATGAFYREHGIPLIDLQRIMQEKGYFSVRHTPDTWYTKN